MSGTFQILCGLGVVVCLFFVSIGLMNYLQNKSCIGEGEVEEETKGEIERRLESVEQRLTDVQDVMIALSEKFDRWEEERTRV